MTITRKTLSEEIECRVGKLVGNVQDRETRQVHARLLRRHVKLWTAAHGEVFKLAGGLLLEAGAAVPWKLMTRILQCTSRRR